MTLPVEALARSGLSPGDDVTIESEGPDVIVVRRVQRDVATGFGVFDGLYESGYLDELRSEERA